MSNQIFKKHLWDVRGKGPVYCYRCGVFYPERIKGKICGAIKKLGKDVIAKRIKET